ncbi:hypothetical protein Q5P01_000649 [Channa striata]|uniref:Uncharacterized protein n=1 Tax=Channa striata TaxID=64152 RepID=A0AA88IJW6_CHASR|nr:hypothetical protein Q5P01_000649 [Channa striata]
MPATHCGFRNFHRFTNVLPAILTYKKAICKSVMDELRRTGNSPTDMANQIMEMMHLKYERANLAYLLNCQNILDGESGNYGQKTITQFIRQETKPDPFGQYSDPEGWNGISVSAHYLTDCLLHEYQHQEGTIKKLLQGTFGQEGHLLSGTMSSYAVMNENWMILSWVMVQSKTENSLRPMYEGLAKRYRSADIEKAQYQWVDRDCCAAFKVADSIPGEHLNWDAWKTSDATVAEATSGNLLNTCASRSCYNANITIKLDLFHCMRRFLRECVSEHHPLYSSFAQFLSAAFSVVDQGDLQRLRDAYRFCGIQPANPAKTPFELTHRVESVFQHFYLAQDPNGIHLFKPTMLKAWRIQRVHILRGCLSDPEVEGGILYRYGGTVQLNHVQGEGAKVSVWIPIRGTSQQEGYHFHQAQWVTGTRVSSELFQGQGMTGVARWNYKYLVDLKQPGVCLLAAFDPALIADLNVVSEQVLGEEKYSALHLSNTDTGEKFGLEYVEPGCCPVPLDWDKHRTKTGYTHGPCPPPQSSTPATQSKLSQTSSLAPTKLFHFSACPPADDVSQPQPGKHMTSKGKYPPPLPLRSSPTAACTGPVKTGGRVFVLDHKRWPAPMKKIINDLLNKHRALVHSSCGNPNSMLQPTTKLHISQYIKHLSKLMNTSSSFNTSPEKLQERQQLWHSLTQGVRPPLCQLALCLSLQLKKRYAAEGLTNPKMPFQDFAATKFFQRELDATKKKTESQHTGRKCQFCKVELKQGPNSPHIDTGFPGMVGKYIYCPSKVFSLYKNHGMEKEMTWKDFQKSPFMR